MDDENEHDMIESEEILDINFGNMNGEEAIGGGLKSMRNWGVAGSLNFKNPTHITLLINCRELLQKLT